jgi:hypothetical protein
LNSQSVTVCISRFQVTASISGNSSASALTESESYVTTDGQSASLSWYKAPIRGLRPDFFFRTEYGIRLTVTFLIPWGALSDERMGLSFVCAAGPCQRRSFLGPSFLVLATVFYCLRFETSHFVASYDSQGHGGGIRPRLHTGSALTSLPTGSAPLCTDCIKNTVSSSCSIVENRLISVGTCSFAIATR